MSAVSARPSNAAQPAARPSGASSTAPPLAAPDPLPGWLAFYRSAIGKKAVMAASGLILTGFVLLHAWGNLKLFQGAEQFNGYARFLREVGYPVLPHGGVLWVMRVGLLVVTGAHVLVAWQLTRQGVSARPVRYAQRTISSDAFTTPVMRLTGVLIGLFAVYHVLHLTTGTAHPAYAPHDAYRNVVIAFQQWPASLAYAVAILALGAHLRHGVWSAAQSLGLSAGTRWRAASVGIALLVTGINLALPAAVLAGVVG